jgi:ribosomal protein S27E
MNVCHESLTVFKYISSAVKANICGTRIFISSPYVAYTVVESVKNLCDIWGFKSMWNMLHC